jgi:hypothetical protein
MEEPMRSLTAYPCHYCGAHFCPDHGNSKQVRSEYDGRLDTILVCDECLSSIAGGANRANIKEFATLIMRMAGE